MRHATATAERHRDELLAVLWRLAPCAERTPDERFGPHICASGEIAVKVACSAGCGDEALATVLVGEPCGVAFNAVFLRGMLERAAGRRVTLGSSAVVPASSGSLLRDGGYLGTIMPLPV